MKSISDCKIAESGYKSKFTVKEEGKTFCITSNRDFYCDVISIDNCVFDKSELRRCDYLLLIPSKHEKVEQFKTSKAIYVELKGDDVKSACEQLYNAIDKTKAQILNVDIEAKVIGTKNFHPNLQSNTYFRKVKMLIRKEIVFHKVHRANRFTYTETI
jgi:hypothetical protein